MASKPLFAFFGTSADSRFALAQLERRGLVPALVVDTKELPVELYNTDWDFFVVASYGKMLSKKVLGLPKHGCINIHPSLLPKFRGPSPYVSAILEDERQTGVTVMLMEEKMDAGPVLAQARIEIAAEDWPPKGLLLSEMLFTEGANLLADALPLLLSGELKPEAQDEAQATYTKKFTDADALLNLGGNQREQFLKVRAFDHNPRAYFINAKNKRIIVTDAEFKDGKLEVLKVIPEGKKEMPYADYLRGQPRR
ncbi:MAG TPA: formyltransferase family protein [Candidatus Paceibacterota bacterium]